MELLGHMLSVFLTLKATTKLFFQVVISVFHSHHECVRVPIASHLHQHLMLTFFFILATLVGVKWCLVTVICISLMTIETFTSFHVYHKYLLFKSYPHWKKGLVCLIALQKLLTDSRYKPFVRYMCCKSLVSVSMLSLLILIGILEVDIIFTLLQRGRN